MNNTAHWIYTGEVKYHCHIYTCSNCGEQGAGSLATFDPQPPGGNYCRWCGYRMIPKDTLEIEKKQEEQQ